MYLAEGGARIKLRVRPARLVLNLALRKPTLRLVVKIWEPQFLNANITYINKKKALEYLQSSAPIAGSSNASELTSGSEDNDNSDNYNTESSNFRIANAHQAVENTGEFSYCSLRR